MPTSNGQVWGPPVGPISPKKVPKGRFSLEPRYQIIALCFLATFCAYVERVGFSIAYTDMAKTAKVDEAVKGAVLSAFYWGYGVSQVCTSVT
jgi:ACS family sodium-dependent inorganic phosphate cotransporter